MATMKFEHALSRLEEIVQVLEKGDLSLEDSLKRFEDGVKLSKSCMKMLEEAEQKVEILLADKQGYKRPRPFAAESAARDRDTVDLDDSELGGEESEETDDKGRER